MERTKEEGRVKPSQQKQMPRFLHGDWLLEDMAMDSSRVAVCCYNVDNKRTYIDVYAFNNPDSLSLQPPLRSRKLFGSSSWQRFISFIDDQSSIVTVCGDLLYLYDSTSGKNVAERVIIEDGAECLTVRESNIYIGLYLLNKVVVFDNSLNTVKAIKLNGIEKFEWPIDIAADKDSIFISTAWDERALKCSMDGSILHEYNPHPELHSAANSVAVCGRFGLVFVLWDEHYVAVYSVSEGLQLFSFTVVNNAARIRINHVNRSFVVATAEGHLCVYNTNSIFTFNHLKYELSSRFTKNDCDMLVDYFSLPLEKGVAIDDSQTYGKNIFHALEERGHIHAANVNRLTNALSELMINQDFILTESYMKLRTHENEYGRFLAGLSVHLTSSIPEELCSYFQFSEENKLSVISSEKPGLSVLLALEEMNVINPSDVGKLQKPLEDYRLLQAVAKIREYQSFVSEIKTETTADLSADDKRKLLIKCLQAKTKGWFETMTPVPWKKSCQWMTNELFIASGLVLTTSGSKISEKDVDEKCKIHYRDIFSHARLKEETRIILEGQPGSGKTMLTSQLAYDWCCGKLMDTPVVIYLPLKIFEDKTIAQAIKMFYIPKDVPITEEDVESFLNCDKERNYLVLDGLEEYNGRSNNGEPSEVMKVINKDKLSKCTVLITARTDYANNLRSYPMLKIGSFGEVERNEYINKIYSDNLERRGEVMKLINNVPFIIDLCSVPLLFVLLVHNIESLVKLKEEHHGRITAFVKGLVECLFDVQKVNDIHQDNLPHQLGCTEKAQEDGGNYYKRDAFGSYVTRPHELKYSSSKHLPKEMSLEKLAFNGLCRGNQQLLWQRQFVESYVSNSKDWIDSGIIVVEEGTPVDVTRTESQGDTLQNEPSVHSDSVKVESSDAKLFTGNTSVRRKVDKSNASFQSSSREPLQSHIKREEFQEKMITNQPKLIEEDENKTNVQDAEESSEVDTSARQLQEETKVEQSFGGATAKHISFQVKFLHKIIQEWFAAKYLSHLFWVEKSTEGPDRYELFMEHLCNINPTDLHYVLRFTSHLCPPSFYLISEFLMRDFKTQDGHVPEFILNYICLCFVEYDGYRGGEMKKLITEICGKDLITIRSEDSRLLLKAKVSMLSFASKSKVPIKHLVLIDVVEAVTSKNLLLKYGVSLGILDTLEAIKVNRWDQKLSDADYKDLPLFIANNRNIEAANFVLPSHPPNVEDAAILSRLQSRNIVVEWIIGAKVVYTLDVNTGEWEMQFQRQGMSPPKPQVVTNVKEMKEDTKEVGESQTRLSDIEEGSVTSADQVSIRTGDNMKYDEGDSLSLRAESMIGKDGGTLDIQNTGVSLQIPPGALQRDYFIQMRIIPHYYLDETVLSFARNSSVVVELLPNNVKLLKPATLTLPHCLVLKKICGWKAKVYSSHHEEGTQPQWEEEINTQCDVTYETCVMPLYNFSWKKVEIGDHIVEAKKIVLFAAQRFSSTNNVTYLDVGYYWQLASCRGVLNLNRVIVLHEIPAVFFKKGQLPLTVLFDKVLPPNWTYNEAENTKEISFSTVAITEGSFCTFLLNKVASDETYGCSCYFKAGQGSPLVDLIFPLKCEDYYQNLPVGQPLNQQHHCGFKRSRIEHDHDHDHESVSASLPLQRHRNVDMPFQSHTQYQDSDTFRRMPAQHLSTLPQSTPSQRYTAVQDVHSMNKESSLSRIEATIPSMGIATAGDTHEELPSAFAQTEDSAVSEESLQELSKKIGKIWRDVGRNLKLTEEQLENLEQKSYPNLKETTYQMLLVWKRKRASAATYDVLADALRKAERLDLREYLLKKYKPT